MQTASETLELSTFFTSCLIGSFIAILSLVAADILFFYWDITTSEPIRLWFIVPREDCLANWYSSLLTLSVGLVALSIYHVKNRQPPWLLVTAFFLYAAVDDATAIHERLGDELKMWIDDSPLDIVILAFPSYSWQLFIAPLFAVVAVYMAWRLSKQLGRKDFLWLLAGFALLGTAILFDFVEGLFLKALSGDSAGHLLRLAEEALEMSGMTLVLYAFGSHLSGLIELSYRSRDQQHQSPAV